MGNIDELFEEDLDFTIGGITATDVNKEIKHKILTGKIEPKDNSSIRNK